MRDRGGRVRDRGGGTLVVSGDLQKEILIVKDRGGGTLLVVSKLLFRNS